MSQAVSVSGGALKVIGDGSSLKTYLTQNKKILDLTGLSNIGTLEKITADVFSGAKITSEQMSSIVIPADAVKIATVSVPAGVTIVNKTSILFDGFATLKKEEFVKDNVLTISDIFQTIAANAFGASFSKVTSIVIPAAVTKIGASAFSGCTNVTTVSFQGDWGSNNKCTIDPTAFNGLNSIANIYVDKDEYVQPLQKILAATGLKGKEVSVAVTSGLSDGAIVGITLAAIFASVCLVVGIVVPIRKRKMNALNHQDGSQTESNE